MSRTPWWRVLAPFAVAGTFLALTALERRRPLRRVREAKWRHVSRNIVFAGAAAATVNAQATISSNCACRNGSPPVK